LVLSRMRREFNKTPLTLTLSHGVERVDEEKRF
jgi:hypothetical protein